MAKKVTIELSKPELRYLYSLALRNREEGTYWGRTDQFIKRQDRIIQKLLDASFLYEEGI